MGKIKILKKEYLRPKRRFSHHEEREATTHQEVVPDEVTHDEVTHDEVPSDEMMSDGTAGQAEIIDKVTITTASEHAEAEASDDSAHDEEAASQIEEAAAPVTPQPAARNSHFRWLYLIPAVLFGMALMMLWHLFADRPAHEKPKTVQETLTKTEKAIKITKDHVVSVVNLQKANNLLNESEVPGRSGYRQRSHLQGH